MENLVSDALYKQAPDWRNVAANALGTALGTAVGSDVAQTMHQHRIDALKKASEQAEKVNQALADQQAALDQNGQILGHELNALGSVPDTSTPQTNPYGNPFGTGIFGPPQNLQTRAANQPYGSTVNTPTADVAKPNAAQQKNNQTTARILAQQRENIFERKWDVLKDAAIDEAKQLAGDFHQGTLGGYVMGAAKEEANVLLQTADFLTGETGLEPQFTITPDERFGADIASVGMFAVPVLGDLRTSKAGFFGEYRAPYSLNPEGVRFSQGTVSYLKERPGQEPYTLDDIMGSMRTEGWKDDFIDVIKMPEGGYTTLDNSRVLSARKAGINVNARVHQYNERLPESMRERFEHPAIEDIFAETWGEALSYRIMRQSMSFMDDNYPLGTYDEPRVTYPRDYTGMRPY